MTHKIGAGVGAIISDSLVR